MSETSERDGWFVRAASRVGDLGSPFYAEERQRDVWNEANAVGFQLLLWLLPLAAVVSVWVGGLPAVPYALVMFVAAGRASWVVLGFAHARGLDLGAAEGVTWVRWRILALLLLLAAFGAGVVVRGAPTGSFAVGMAWGLLAGAVLGVLALAVSARRARRVSAGGTSS